MLYFSHIRLNQSPSMQAIASLLLPSDKHERLSAQHKLLWSAFSDDRDRRRDFLWREQSDGSFLTLSQRPPIESDLFMPHRVKDYDPHLNVGDQFEFSLLANATRTKPGGEQRGQRVDVVMDALHGVEKGERASKRMDIAQAEGEKWLTRQAEKSGFVLREVLVEDYRVDRVRREGRSHKEDARFGLIDFTGVLEVSDPALLLDAVSRGFGRAKSFGCGLMLLKRLS